MLEIFQGPVNKHVLCNLRQPQPLVIHENIPRWFKLQLHWEVRQRELHTLMELTCNYVEISPCTLSHCALEIIWSTLTSSKLNIIFQIAFINEYVSHNFISSVPPENWLHRSARSLISLKPWGLCLRAKVHPKPKNSHNCQKKAKRKCVCTAALLILPTRILWCKMQVTLYRWL